MLHIKTDNPDRKVFVYKQDKFRNEQEMITEIEKSIANETKRKIKKHLKTQNTIKDIEEEPDPIIIEKL